MCDVLRCSCCQVLKHISDFVGIVRGAERLRKTCGGCRSNDRAYYQANRHKIIAEVSHWQRQNRESRKPYQRSYMASIRADVVSHLGGKCCRCGFTDARALQIDHVHGDGWRELRKGGLGSYAYMKKVLADREGRYQLLCANCNWIKRAEENEQPNIGKAAAARAAGFTAI